MRGLSFPGCGRAVTVPISTNPKPSIVRPRIARAFLSNPPARPNGAGTTRPKRRTLPGPPARWPR